MNSKHALITLSDAAEVHLFEVLGRSISSSPEGSAENGKDGSTGPMTSEEVSRGQVLLLQKCADYLMQVMSQLLSYLSTGANSSDLQSTIMFLLGKQLHALSSVVKHIPKLQRQLYLEYVNNLAMQLLPSLMPLLVANTSPTSSSSDGRTSLKQKIMTFLHHLIVLLDQGSIPILSSALPVLVNTAEVQDVEALIQLVNQFLIEFEEQAIPCFYQVFPLFMEKFRHFQSQHVFMQSSAASSGSATQVGEVEYVGMMKQCISFIQHIIQYHNDCIVYDNSAHRNYLPEVLDMLLHALKGYAMFSSSDGSRRKFSYSLALPMRRTSVLIMIALIQNWLFPNPQLLRGVTADHGKNNNDAVVARNIPSVDNSMKESLLSFLMEHYIPTVFILLGQPNQKQLQLQQQHLQFLVADYDVIKLQNKDAGTQIVITEIAALLWTVIHKNPDFVNKGKHDEFAQYLQALLTKMCWQEATIVTLLELLFHPNINLGNCKDQMKTFVRNVLV